MWHIPESSLALLTATENILILVTRIPVWISDNPCVQLNTHAECSLLSIRVHIAEVPDSQCVDTLALSRWDDAKGFFNLETKAIILDSRSCVRDDMNGIIRVLVADLVRDLGIAGFSTATLAKWDKCR